MEPLEDQVEKLDKLIEKYCKEGFPEDNWPELKAGQVVFILTQIEIESARENLDFMSEIDSFKHDPEEWDIEECFNNDVGLSALVCPMPQLKGYDYGDPELELLALYFTQSGMSGTDHYYIPAELFRYEFPKSVVRVIDEPSKYGKPWLNNSYGG